MFMPGSLRCCTTQSIAAMTCETSALPRASATLRLISRAPGAMPAYELGEVLPSEPAMMPAMKVPWPKVSRYRVSGFCDSNEMSGPFTTLPGAVSPATGAIPESMSATSTPRPVIPLPHTSRARVTCVMLNIEPASSLAS